MKKILLLSLLLILSGCKTKDEEVCDGTKELDHCIDVSFKICDGDCESDKEDAKYFSFGKSQAYNTLTGTYFSELEESRLLPGIPEQHIYKTDLESIVYNDHKTDYYHYIKMVSDDYFGISTNIDNCTDDNFNSGCVLELGDNRTITNTYLYGETVFEVNWNSVIDNSEYNLDTSIVFRGDNELDNYDFEYLKTESGSKYDTLTNTYAFHYDGIMRVYMHQLDNDGSERFVYYMYDSVNGNMVSYSHENNEYKLNYYIANHNKMYSIEKLNEIGLEIYSVTYYNDSQDALSVRAIRKDDNFIAMQLSYNLQYVDGWDELMPYYNELKMDNELVALNGFLLKPVSDYVEGTSPYRLTKDMSVEEFGASKLFISNDLSFDQVTFESVNTDISNMMLNYEGYQSAFGISFKDTINQDIIDYINSQK